MKQFFNGYDYKEVEVKEEMLSFYLDGYQNFGWEQDANMTGRKKSLYLKRDRKIINKVELTRLQRHFEACASQITVLEKSKNKPATIWALTIGVMGTVFMAGSTFAVTANPPIIWLCCLLAFPGFAGWIFPYFIYNKMIKLQTKKLAPLLEEKYDEIYEICQKGRSLL